MAFKGESNVVNGALGISTVIAACPKGGSRGKSQLSDPSLLDDGHVRTAVELAAQWPAGGIGDRMSNGDIGHGRGRMEGAVVSRHGSTRQLGRRDFEDGRRLLDANDEKRRVTYAHKHPRRQGFVVAVVGNDAAMPSRIGLIRMNGRAKVN